MKELSPAERMAAARQRSKYPLTNEFAQHFDFPLDDFQLEGCHALEMGRSVLVAAPTGAGKTIVGEFAAFLADRSSTRCFYTTPIKALSNQKFQELTEKYGASEVGLLTGDSSINGDAPIVVMTTEVLRNMIYANPIAIENLGYVVMDEVHYLADKFRGAVWEEILIHLPERIQVVSLSATVSNAEEFGEWLQTVRGSTNVVLSEIRPVPLYQHILIGNRLLDMFVDDGRVNPEIVRLERNSAKRIPSGNRWKEKGFSSIQQLSRPDIIEKLRHASYLPVIYFIFSRAGCDAAVAQCVREGISLTTNDERDLIREAIARRTSELPTEDFGVLQFYEWCQALERGIASHHAGLLPMFKETIEELFQRGLLKVVFATETLALGINMPARTVLIEKLIKWNGETHAVISPGEYTQLTGRAGRRGIDTEGNAVVVWSDQIDSSMAAGLASTRTYPLRSSFSPSYNMSANLIARFGAAKARKSLGSSFAQFQADRSVIGLLKQIEKNARAIEDLNLQGQCHLGDMTEYMSFRFAIKDLEVQISDRRNRKRNQKELSDSVGENRALMKAHPCHQCPDRENHSRLFEKASRLERERSGLKTRMESRTNVIPRTFDRVLGVLHELRYLDGEALTGRGKLLARIYSESDLLLAEVIHGGVFDDLQAPDLAALISGLLFEGRGERSKMPRIPRSLENKIKEVVRVWSQLYDLETSEGLPGTREPNFDMLWSVHRWANGTSLNTILRESDITVGDFVRHIRQVIDLLGQIAEASPQLMLRAREAISRIDRGVITYSAVVA